MVFLSTLTFLVAILCLWVLPVVLGIRAAKRNNRSPHWMWFGVHPVGAWIAYLVLQFASPQKRCSECGEQVRFNAKVCPYCTTAFANVPLSTGFTTVARKRNWLRIGGILGAVLLGFCGFLLATWLIIDASFDNSGAYQQALQRAQTDPRITELLGSPITDGTFTSGSITTYGNSSGEANLSIPLKGPKGRARLYVLAELRAGLWTFQTLEVTPENGQFRINLLEPK